MTTVSLCQNDESISMGLTGLAILHALSAPSTDRDLDFPGEQVSDKYTKPSSVCRYNVCNEDPVNPVNAMRYPVGIPMKSVVRTGGSVSI